jgi:hypothetical protein
MNLIGICGKAGSGKDTIADILVRDHGLAKIALADPLKRIALDVFAFTFEQLWGPSAMRNAPDMRYPRPHGPWSNNGKCLCCGSERVSQCYLTPRFALQQLGTEWGRNCYPNVWVDYALRVADQLLFHLKDGRTHDYDKHRHYNYHPRVGLFPRAGNDEEAAHGNRIEGVVISDVRFPNEVEALHGKSALIWKATHGAGLTGAAGDHVSELHIDRLDVDLAFPSMTLEALPLVIAKALRSPRGATISVEGLKHTADCAKTKADRAWIEAEFDGQHPEMPEVECTCGVIDRAFKKETLP